VTDLHHERRVPFAAGAFNVRDLGGLRTSDGRSLRRGVAYRADGLHRLPPEEVRRLADLGVRTVVDLRTASEIEVAASVVAAEPVVVVHLPILQEVWPHDAFDEADTADPVAFLVARYLEMLEEGASAIGAIFGLLAEPERRPLAFHCSAGKDRTGVIAALLLAVAGVPDDEIAEDYTTSAAAMAKLVEWVEARSPEAADAMAKQPAAFLSCPPEAMHVFLDRVRERWGSVEGYLDSIGVDGATVAAVRAALLGDDER
jgi:protein-tyrosine phosphatase